MNKKLIIAIVVVAALSLAMVPLASAKPGGVKPLKCAPPNNGQAGKSNTAHLYLYIPSATGVAKGEPWGKMKYNLSGPDFNFVFNGKSLTPDTDYTLITAEEDTLVIGGGTCTTDADCPVPTTCTNPAPAPPDPGTCTTAEVPTIVFNCLGSKTANGGGNVNIKNSLPDLGDFPEPPGVEIWLVASADLPENCTTGEVPLADLTTVLEGCDTISFDDTDPPPAP